MSLQHSLSLNRAIDNAISPDSAVKDPAISLVETEMAKALIPGSIARTCSYKDY